jgi:hypothetical protein
MGQDPRHFRGIDIGPVRDHTIPALRQPILGEAIQARILDPGQIVRHDRARLEPS